LIITIYSDLVAFSRDEGDFEAADAIREELAGRGVAWSNRRHCWTAVDGRCGLHKTVGTPALAAVVVDGKEESRQETSSSSSSAAAAAAVAAAVAGTGEALVRERGSSSVPLGERAPGDSPALKGQDIPLEPLRYRPCTAM